jgi:6,7-dimethyl-8-ribityllumazine synthase
MSAAKKNILIVQSVFYEKISEMLLKGATKEITQSGNTYEVITVPGVFEIPAAIAIAKDKKQRLFTSYNRYDGFVALGCVIRGQTSHSDYVCNESARGLSELALKEKLAIGYGILTVENEAQALERADSNKKDKGGFAAYTCIQMMALKDKYKPRA